MTARAGRRLQVAMAVGGFALGGLGVIGALAAEEGPAAPWLLRLYAAWCVAVPYWWYLEHRLLCPREPDARREFEARQGHSRFVWLGFALAMGGLILARAAG